MFGDDAAGGLEDGGRRDDAADAGARIDRGVAAYDGAGIEYGIAAYLSVVSYHCSHFPAVGIDVVFPVDDDVGVIGLDVGGYGTGSEVGVVAQDAVAGIVEVTQLHVVEHDQVLDLNSAAYSAVGTDECSVAYHCTMEDVGVRPDDYGA